MEHGRGAVDPTVPGEQIDGHARVARPALDRLVPLQPAWALVYGSLYLFLILLPAFVIRHQEQIRRTVSAYLTVWIAAHVCFLLYPTVTPPPPPPSPHPHHSTH